MTWARQSGQVLRLLLLANHWQRHCDNLVVKGTWLLGKAYAVAIGVPARYDVWLVEQATAYFAGDMGPQAVEIGL